MKQTTLYIIKMFGLFFLGMSIGHIVVFIVSGDVNINLPLVGFVILSGVTISVASEF